MSKNSKRSNRIGGKVNGILSQADLFGETVGFDIRGSTSVKGIFGAFLSLAIMGVVFAYGTNKYLIMKNREGTDYQEKFVK